MSMRVWLLGAAMLASSGLQAGAADLYGGAGGLKDGGYAPAGESFRRAWYLRVDGGYSWSGKPSITETQVCGSCSTTYDLTDTNMSSGWSIGGGVGLHVTNRIRADLTYDHLFDNSVTGWLGSGELQGQRHFDVKSDVFLANVYYDFNLGSRFTPYIGAGIGFARNKTGSGTVDDCGCVIGDIASGSSTSFAAAGMAGVAITLRSGETVVGGGMKDAPVVVENGRKLALDIGYRYLYLGDVSTGAVTRAGATFSDDPTVHNMDDHQLRVGLRYDLQ